MDDTSLHVTARISASEGLVLAVEGYLDGHVDEEEARLREEDS